jgi:hypothetical protein
MAGINDVVCKAISILKNVIARPQTELFKFHPIFFLLQRNKLEELECPDDSTAFGRVVHSMPEQIEEIIMHRTYLIETRDALFTFLIAEMRQGGPYSATYVGTARRAGHSRTDSSEWDKANLDGAAEGVDFNALVAMCHREMTRRGGDIVSVQDISGDVRL